MSGTKMRYNFSLRERLDNNGEFLGFRRYESAAPLVIPVTVTFARFETKEKFDNYTGLCGEERVEEEEVLQ
jgi:hypothetical protein